MERSALQTPDGVARKLQFHPIGRSVERITHMLGCPTNTLTCFGDVCYAFRTKSTSRFG